MKTTNNVEFKKLRRTIIKEEFVALTKDTTAAVILSQMEFWQLRVSEFDKFIQEEVKRCSREGVDVNIFPTEGWIYKTAEELIKDCMLTISKQTMLRAIKHLVNNKWVLKRNNPHLKWDRTVQYRLNLLKIKQDLEAIGYELQGWIIGKQKSSIDKPMADHANSKMELGDSTLEFGFSTMEQQYHRSPSEITTEDNIYAAGGYGYDDDESIECVGYVQKPKKAKQQNKKNLVSSPEAKEVLDYLNSKTNTSFSYSPELNARLEEGYAVGQCKRIIDHKVSQWLRDAKMRRYLRPPTLFGSEKILVYLGELPKDDGTGTMENKLPSYLCEAMGDD